MPSGFTGMAWMRAREAAERAWKEKKPRLFFWNEPHGVWTQVPEQVESILDLPQFADVDAESVVIHFKRVEISDEELENCQVLTGNHLLRVLPTLWTEVNIVGMTAMYFRLRYLRTQTSWRFLCERDEPSDISEEQTENYQDIDGNPISLEQLVRKEPDWAANRIRHCNSIHTAFSPGPVSYYDRLRTLGRR